MDAALSDDDQRRSTGLTALEQMQDSRLADSQDQVLLAAMAREIVAETIESLDQSGNAVAWVETEGGD